MTRFEDIKYERSSVEDVKTALDEFLQAEKAATCADDVLIARNKWLEALSLFSTNSSVASVRYTLNTRDEFYLKEQEYYDETYPIVISYVTEYQKALLNSRFAEELERKLPETLFPTFRAAIKAHSDEVVADEQEENSLSTEYSNLLSQLTTEWQGEQKTISYIRGFLEDKDRNVRRMAAMAIDRALASVGDQLDEIYDKLVKVRTRIARKLGYKNFVELGYYRMNRIDYDEKMVATFRENVKKDIVPVVQKLKKRIQDALGIEKITFYDNDVIEGEGNPRPYPSAEGILQAAKEMYADMNAETGKLMQDMYDANLFDVIARDGKCGGGYCTTFETYRQPFIFANFNGSSGDVEVVTHEFGHAIAMYQAFSCGDAEVAVGSMETAETHSMGMEFFTWKYMDKFFKDTKRYCYKHLADAFSFIPYGVIVDEFQHVVYENPDMTPAERNEAYLNLEKKYRPYLSYEGLDYLGKGTRWQYQSHIYESPFYYIDYCLAQIVAMEFLTESQKDYDNALSRYFEHTKRGGLYPFNKLVLMAGLRSPFEDGALKAVADVVSELIDQLR